MDLRTLLKEIADRSSDPTFILGLSWLPNPDEVLRKAGVDQKVYDQVLTDPHVMSKVVDRRAGMLRREWTVEAADDSRYAARAADLCSDALKRLENHDEYPLESSLGQLQEAALRGWRALEIVWERNGANWMPLFLRDIPNRRLIHNGNEWRLLTISEPVYGIVLPERKVLMATHLPSSDNPYGEALLSRCYWPYMFKHNGLKWWVTLAEKHGIPWVVGKLGGQADEEARRQLLNNLVALVLDAVTVLPREAEFSIEGLAGVTPDVHDRLIATCNADISKILVGQTLSTELDQSGGSRAAAETHSGLRDEIVDADAKMVARVMNRLLAWITELNFGSSDFAPEFKWVEEDKPDKTWAEVVEIATRAIPGKVPLRWAYDKIGIGEEYRDDEEFVGTASTPSIDASTPNKTPDPASDTLTTELPGKTPESIPGAENNFARNDFTPEQQSLEGLAEESIAEGVETLAANEEAILSAVTGSTSYEEAMERLLTLFPQLATAALEDILARTLLAADLFGRMQANTGDGEVAP
jgi:phage gp29-like protein